jgi:hypothetical protein
MQCFSIRSQHQVVSRQLSSHKPYGAPALLAMERHTYNAIHPTALLMS